MLPVESSGVPADRSGTVSVAVTVLLVALNVTAVTFAPA